MVKNLTANAGEEGDEGLIPGLGRSPGGRNSKPTPVLLPGKSHGQRSLVGYRPWGHKEWDTAQRRSTQHTDSSEWPTFLFCFHLVNFFQKGQIISSLGFLSRS